MTFTTFIVCAAVVCAGVLSGCSQRDHKQTSLQEKQEWSQHGQEFQKAGIMSESDYSKILSMGKATRDTGTLSDDDVVWLVSRLKSGTSIQHARVMAIFEILRNPPPHQQALIAAAIAPLLHNGDTLDEHYAASVTRKLRLQHGAEK